MAINAKEYAKLDLFKNSMSGIDAANAGQPLSDNPYGVGSQDYYHWRVQWLLMQSVIIDDITYNSPAPHGTMPRRRLAEGETNGNDC